MSLRESGAAKGERVFGAGVIAPVFMAEKVFSLKPNEYRRDHYNATRTESNIFQNVSPIFTVRFALLGTLVRSARIIDESLAFFLSLFFLLNPPFFF